MMARTDSSALVVSPAPRLAGSHWLPESPSKSPATTHDRAMNRNAAAAPRPGGAAVEHRESHCRGLAAPRGGGGGGGGEGEGRTARCEWDFQLCSVISPTATREVSDALGAIEFDPSDQFLATGGIARKIRIYSLRSLLPEDREGGAAALSDHSAACSFYICTPAKLSSLRWKPDGGGRVIGAGDYDGVVTEYDLERRVSVFERDEHDGRRVWSVDYSRWLPQLGGSASDDGTAQMWDSRCGGGAACSLCPAGESRGAVCSVEFDPSGGPLVGMGCADRRAYVYDLRMTAAPVTVFGGHHRTVTYVRFADGGKLVSAGTDGCLRLWSLLDGREARAYEGHVNTRSFVGLSVWKSGGLLACGSETNQVFVYDVRWGEPIWVGGFEAVEDDGGRGFVSSVCWRQAGGDACTIVAGASNGVLQVFSGKKKPLPL